MSEVLSYQAISNTWQRKGRTTITPPAAPGTLTAVAGNAQATLTWGASATPGVTYQVKRVNQNTVVWSGSGLSAVITGLVNGVTYNFQVFAVDPVTGLISGPSNVATAVPTGGGQQITTLWGFNYNNKDTSLQTIAGRESMFGGRVPMVRVYGTAGQTAKFSVSTSVAVEKRVCYSYKAGGSFTEAQLGNGAATPTMVQWLESIPPSWFVVWVYHHEPNDANGSFEVDPTNFKNTYHQMRLAVNQARLQTGVTVKIACNFMASAGIPTGSTTSNAHWQDSWVPSPADADWMTWDIYGNPGNDTPISGSNKYGGPASGNAYDCLYPLASSRSQPMFDTTVRCGFANNWGILELNSPLRNWDTTEHGRVLWHQDMNALIEGGHNMPGAAPARICLIWEAPSGASWFQEYGSNLTGGTNNAYTNRANSPMWGVYAPLMASVPVGGQ